MSDLHPTPLELEERIIRWLGGRRYVADHIELARARDRAHDVDRGGVYSLTVARDACGCRPGQPNHCREAASA